jgi:hypothetical protein
MAADLKADQCMADQLRSWWFCLVSEISDLDLQRRTWLNRTNQNPHWSYIEFASSFPEHDQIVHAHQQGWLTAGEFEILNGLRLALDTYSPPGGDHYDNAAVLDDPAWHAVVEAADRGKQQLLSIATDQHEREALFGSTWRAPI